MEYVTFDNALFAGLVDFDEVKFNASRFYSCCFKELTSFTQCHFSGDTTFNVAHFHSALTLRGTTFSEEALSSVAFFHGARVSRHLATSSENGTART